MVGALCGGASFLSYPPSPGQSRDPQCLPLPCDEQCKGLWVVAAVNHRPQLHCWIKWRTSRLLCSVSNWFSRVKNSLVSLFPGACLSCIDFLQVTHTKDTSTERLGFYWTLVIHFTCICCCFFSFYRVLFLPTQGLECEARTWSDHPHFQPPSDNSGNRLLTSTECLAMNASHY